MYEDSSSFVSWMISGGARIEDPDTRFIEHQRALRDVPKPENRIRAFVNGLQSRLATPSPAGVACEPCPTAA